MTTNLPNEPLFIQIGRKRYQVASLQHASEMYCKARDASGHGASRVPEGKIVTADGRLQARISYNGRVWPAAPWFPGQQPILENRA